MEANLSESISLQQEAANESTSCDRLFELATSTNLARLIAKNPSAPPDSSYQVKSEADKLLATDQKKKSAWQRTLWGEPS